MQRAWGKTRARLSAHLNVNQIVFTGSVPTGIAIATAAAGDVVPCVLELGGKSAAIVHEDADLEAFETDTRWGIYFNAGQVCSAMSRVIVHESRHDEVLERSESVARSFSIGPGMERTEFGPSMRAMVSDAQRDRALGMVSKAPEQNARLITGGYSKSGYGREKGREVLWNYVQTRKVAKSLKGQSLSAFDEGLFLKGPEHRRATLGVDHVERNLAAADDLTSRFQEAMTAWCWGVGWGDDVIDVKTRSMMNLSVIGALGRMSEREFHCRGAPTTVSPGVSSARSST